MIVATYTLVYYRQAKRAKTAAPNKVMIPTTVLSPAPVLLWLGLAAPTLALDELLAAEDPEADEADEADPEAELEELDELAEADEPDPRDASS